MRKDTQIYFNRLRALYTDLNDQDSLMALAEVSEMENRAHELKIYREQPKTQELIVKTLSRYKNCVRRLTDTNNRNMTQDERTYLFACMDWCLFTLDIVGENPNRAEEEIDNLVRGYADKVGLIHT